MSFVWQVLLYSMHKYFARLVISEVKKPSSGKEAQPPRVVYQEDFPETTFIAVTAYQNEEVGMCHASRRQTILSSFNRLLN